MSDAQHTRRATPPHADPRIYEDIRRALAGSGKSRYAVSRETGIGQAQLSGFMKGAKGLSVASLEKLADCLELDLIARPRGHPRRRGTPKRGGR